MTGVAPEKATRRAPGSRPEPEPATRRQLRSPEVDVRAWFEESHVWIVTGKGGVGKTTVTGALATTAAAHGLTVLVVTLEGGSEPTGTPGATTERIRTRRVTADEALLEYLGDHGLRRVARRLASSGALDVVATAIPGIRDVLVLGKVKQLERAGAAEVIVVDAPASGHALTFLTSAGGLLAAARGGPIRQQAAEVVELIGDPARCTVVPVTLPEEMPVTETIESAFLLEDRVGAQLGPVVVNCSPTFHEALEVPATDAAREAGVRLDAPTTRALEAAREHTLHRVLLARAQIARLERELPLPQIHLPVVTGRRVGPLQLDHLARAVEQGIEALEPRSRT